MMQKISDFKIKLCKNCFNCKTSNKKIYCKMGYFDNISEDTTLIYTPYDFDCYDYDDM